MKERATTGAGEPIITGVPRYAVLLDVVGQGLGTTFSMVEQGSPLWNFPVDITNNDPWQYGDGRGEVIPPFDGTDLRQYERLFLAFVSNTRDGILTAIPRAGALRRGEGCSCASKTIRSVLCRSGEFEAVYHEAVAMMTIAKKRRAEVDQARQLFRKPHLDKLKQKLLCVRCGQLGHLKDDNDCPKVKVVQLGGKRKEQVTEEHHPILVTSFRKVWNNEGCIRYCQRPHPGWNSHATPVEAVPDNKTFRFGPGAVKKSSEVSLLINMGVTKQLGRVIDLVQRTIEFRNFQNVKVLVEVVAGHLTRISNWSTLLLFRDIDVATGTSRTGIQFFDHLQKNGLNSTRGIHTSCCHDRHTATGLRPSQN